MEDNQKPVTQQKPDEAPNVVIEGFLKITDPESKETIFEGRA